MSKREQLLLQALVYAVQDRESFADAWERNSPEGQQAYQLAQDFRALHKELTGQKYLTPFEEDEANATSVSIYDLKKGQQNG